jgi:hypothetical protein
LAGAVLVAASRQSEQYSRWARSRRGGGMTTSRGSVSDTSRQPWAARSRSASRPGAHQRRPGVPLVGEDQLLAAIAARLGALGLELHPGKTKIVFCKDANRRGDFEHTSFDFLGYTFRGHLAKGRGGYFTGFNPAISATAKKAKGKQIRDWHLNRRSGTDLSGLAKEINPQVQGWINYYGPSTAPSCASWHGVSTSTSPGGPCTNSNDSAASTPKRWPG